MSSQRIPLKDNKILANLNSRRLDLLDKKLKSKLTKAESKELEDLQEIIGMDVAVQIQNRLKELEKFKLSENIKERFKTAREARERADAISKSRWFTTDI